VVHVLDVGSEERGVELREGTYKERVKGGQENSRWKIVLKGRKEDTKGSRINLQSAFTSGVSWGKLAGSGWKLGGGQRWCDKQD